ncbi:phage gp6-like head-tail connector protein (plasmid) [Paracoccus versutus]|uniref:Gp6-like head-tail connector protein n=1 Tax=Paracoccus versutus TaxID=34007 RepID=A0AAQ0HBR1_PARVE|nr:head-tail connector protein [Paracoccus versutus]REG26212.1 gp6-like head-tail connector protein [Paracoccus versutus]WEJ80961.1 phage gp6-like head-tail connector protein [Paracoccus versutus]WEJ81891.1 phage gp6-like head-tail connector protein [Paracoccus versutus]
MPIPLALVRAHLNFLPDEAADDAILTHYGNVAEAWVASYTGLPFDADNPLMLQAALMLIAHQYEAREAVTFASAYQLPFGVTDLLSGIKRQVLGYVPEVEGTANG